MKKIIILSLLLAVFSACNKDELPSGTPECIKDKIEELSKQGSQQVSLAIINGEDLYWHHDGLAKINGVNETEFIYDASCALICVFCEGCSNPPPCAATYKDGEWTVIWEQ